MNGTPTCWPRTSPAALKLAAVLLVTATVWMPSVKAADVDSFSTIVKPAFKQHCGKCHGAMDVIEAELNLLQLRAAENLTDNAELLGQLIEALDTNAMPPGDERPLPPKLRQKLLAEFRSLLDTALTKDRAAKATPMRRMNRFQYNNAVQDLFQLKRVVFALPERMVRDHSKYFQPASRKMPDRVKVGSRPLGKSQLIEARLAGVAPFPQDLRAEHGFDNRGDHLSLSPLLYESFLNLSRTIVESPDFNAKTCGIWKTFFAQPAPDKSVEVEVRQRLSGFLTHAFRRPVQDELLDRYTKHVLKLMEQGTSFTDSMKAVASAAIASPKFLYLYNEAEQPAQQLDSFELASRLSFFLWGSIPDQTLLNLAADGTLSQPAVLSAQVDRMLDDPQLKRFCDSFPAQWLQLDRIISSVPDRERFPDFYFSKYRNSMHMMLEPLLLFETVLIEDRPILDLIDADFSYRSNRLELIYYQNSSAPKKNEVVAIPFVRRPVTDRRYGGVITNAAVMTMTSGPERTKPITRGAWLAAVIFNDPPEPPPADVPPLSEEPPPDEQNLTLRERFAAHRERADCAGCHEKIDPLGFALENFGPTGKWRDAYSNGRDVDMNGTLFRRSSFSNVVEFKDAILAEKDRFAKALASHLLSFALARELAVADSPAIGQIAAESASRDYRMRAMIKAVVMSDPFRGI